MRTGISINQTIVLVGMMGVGKTSVGRKLAKYLGLPFFDSDHEVELAAGSTISDIYDMYGESAFRDTEYRVIRRLIENEQPHVLSTGVGAFADERTKKLVKSNTISIWIDADIEKIIPRITKRSHRPQLREGSTEETIDDLMKIYTPHYQQADVKVKCDTESANNTINEILEALESYSSGVSE